MNSFTPQAGALEEHYKRMAAGWREKCVELQEENALLRKRAPSAPGLYQATVDASGVLVVERLIVAEADITGDGMIVMDARELGF
jgi:hypothetical protein